MIVSKWTTSMIVCNVRGMASTERVGHLLVGLSQRYGCQPVAVNVRMHPHDLTAFRNGTQWSKFPPATKVNNDASLALSLGPHAVHFFASLNVSRGGFQLEAVIERKTEPMEGA